MISVVIPVYNSALYLMSCLESLQRQSCSDWEAILVDDASTDGSADLAASFAEADKRFRLIRLSENGGQSAARNKGMKAIKGNYLTFIDSDDSVEPDYLETLLREIGNNDLLQTGYKRISIGGDIIEEKCPNWGKRFTLTSPCMRLYRTAWLQEKGLRFPEGMIYEDVLFSAQVWQQKPKIRVYHYTGYRYLVNPESTTSRPHDTNLIFSKLREQGIGLFQFNALRLRLRAHFIKQLLFRK